MPVNEASLRVYFMGSFHRKFVYQNCVFDIFKNIENDCSLNIEEKCQLRIIYRSKNIYTADLFEKFKALIIPASIKVYIFLHTDVKVNFYTIWNPNWFKKYIPYWNWPFFLFNWITISSELQLLFRYWHCTKNIFPLRISSVNVTQFA